MIWPCPSSSTLGRSGFRGMCLLTADSRDKGLAAGEGDGSKR